MRRFAEQEDAVAVTSAEVQISLFGQTPVQLFVDPHPPRGVRRLRKLQRRVPPPPSEGNEGSEGSEGSEESEGSEGTTRRQRGGEIIV